MAFLDFLFGGENPANVAQPYFNRINENARPLQERFAGLANNPTGSLEELLAKYKPSAAYNLKNEEAQKAIGNSAAAGGVRGTPQDLAASARLSESLLGEDMQQWLNNVLGLQNTGLQGEYNLFGDTSNALGTQGSLAFQGQREENNRFSDILKSLSGLAGAAGGTQLLGNVGHSVNKQLFPQYEPQSNFI